MDNLKMEKKWVALTASSLITMTWAAQTECALEPPVICSPDVSIPCQSCLGPEEFAGNPPARLSVCRGNWSLNFSSLYWYSHQDGLEFAIKNGAGIAVINPLPSDIQLINQLTNAEYNHPSTRGQFGYRFGLDYIFDCDGWDLGLIWTDYHDRSKKVVHTNIGVSSAVTLWSAFTPAQGDPVFARGIVGTWKFQLNMLDLSLGRKYWVSRMMNVHPFIGLRYSRVSQDLNLSYEGGSWSPRSNPLQPPFNNAVHLDNIYKGTGLRAGVAGEYHLGCGFNLYGNLAVALLYGHFKTAHNETNTLAVSPLTPQPILSTKERFKASRPVLDLGLGIQWSVQFFECCYGLTTRFGWEQHLFFDQNQLWRVNRVGSSQQASVGANFSNLTGQNLFKQRRGSLGAQGCTLSFTFEF
jgi:hypothetical protein